MRFGGGAGGDPGGELGAIAVGLYIELELLSLFCRALNFSFPVSKSISSRELFSSADEEVQEEVGVADIFLAS